MFIRTANDMDTRPRPLRDRMEVIALAGYTEEEKLQIAKRYLVPRQIERNGLKQLADRVHRRRRCSSDHRATTRARRACATSSARSARSAARSRARSPRARASARSAVSAPKVRELLGRPRFQPDVRRRTAEPGVATGLAWTPVGGDVLFVEASAMPGEGKLTITGQLGDVMRESAAGGAHVRARPRRILTCRGLVRQARRARARARGRDPQGRPERRDHDGHGADVAGLRPPGARRHRDDRRADADGPGAADRRPQGEGAGGSAGRDPSRSSPRAATKATSRTSPSTCARISTSCGSVRSARSSMPHYGTEIGAVDAAA